MSTQPTTKALEDIARRHLRIETLQQRFSDSLDFHDCGVWCIEEALKEAWQQGFAAGQTQGEKEAKQ